MMETLDLPPVLDLVAAPGLLEAFNVRRGQDLAVDASAVQRLGAQCLQILLAARAAWAADGQELGLKAPSTEFSAALELMGASPAQLTHQATTGHKEQAA
ncbi:STAS domain-containing protein [Acidocella sp. KAb 2-4]|uniref:STAS domain-containing protein n=1 Tax=Acidocella sp. KAb 2-4 TaxID=2885158 RepID=UPI001D06C1F5|nr:STAS domain-containing protein [Acidocella sp. KAb 2-4]MCB5945294.1 STAS domain-containing protein [Acidocella sp. KAb 2-4]